uniref:CBM20 domain-containing protein n=2 Tax=Chlamydomonas euryale TaxID=1486919 RepID=A0A7R9VQR9_9CHLO
MQTRSRAAARPAFAADRAVRPGPLGRRRGGGRSRALTVSAFAESNVPLTIEVKKEVPFGQVVRVCGSNEAFGAWKLDKAPKLKWHDGHVWRATMTIPVGETMKFKLVVTGDGEPAWEGGSDRELTALGPDYGLTAACNWDATSSMTVDAFEIASGNNGSNGSNGAAAKPAFQPSKERKREPAMSGGGGGSGSDSGPGSALSSMEEESRGLGGTWAGAEPEFVRSRQDKTQRGGTWDTSGLEGVALAVVEGDKEAANWLKKLDLTKQLLVDRPPMMRPGLDELSHSFVYTTWINSGAIACAEAGSHYRPNHHSNLALKMFRSLEWVIGDASHATNSNGSGGGSDALVVMAARRMHARLPSISGEFRQSVPLTRIRDIAHRNDIPHDLKQEIKHTLQNKLHRCAGPEDLVASEKMLRRVTANPGEYNDAFVNEFKVFVRELRDFFNASGLEDVIAKTTDTLDAPHAAAVEQLLSSKRKVEGGGASGSLDDLMALLFAVTQARTHYASGLQAGLRNDVNDDVLETRQRWRLSEVRLEEYTFVVLSRVVNVLEQQGGAEALAKSDNDKWALPLSALTAGLRNLGLSQFKAKELLALENELQAWHSAGPLTSGGKETAMRAKASLDRVLRLCGEYSDALMRVYSKPAADLGRALGVPPHMASVFGESETRGSVAFQLSKLAALLSKALRIAAGQSSWDGLVTGEAVGKLYEVDRLTPDTIDALSKEHSGGMLLLLVKEADGDEELGPLVPLGLRGVVLCQEMAHLSHLGVRARQEHVVFATLDDRELLAQAVHPLVGEQCSLTVAPGGQVTLEKASTRTLQRALTRAVRGAENAPVAETLPLSDSWQDTKRVSSPKMLKMSDTTTENAGSKAGKCAELEHLARNSGGLFSTPVSVALPFGCMDAAIDAAGSQVATEYQEVLEQLEEPLSGDALEKACDRMQALVRGIAVPPALLDQLRGSFHEHAMLVLRSSANVEDLAGMSAAGLYESVVGVPVADADGVAKAIAEVWASLYTRRAVLSRRVAKVPQRAATMGVLVQELHCPKVSFVLHTARPSDMDESVMLVEAAPGQGETLASGAVGTPWRLEVEKKPRGKVDTLAFANFSRALVPVPSRLIGQRQGQGSRTLGAGLVETEVDYSKQRITVDAEYRADVGQRLAAVGVAIEAYFGKKPQDIEGGLVETEKSDADIFIFQSRPQS